MHFPLGCQSFEDICPEIESNSIASWLSVRAAKDENRAAVTRETSRMAISPLENLLLVLILEQNRPSPLRYVELAHHAQPCVIPHIIL